MLNSLYQQLGGAPSMSKAAEIFYRKMLIDDRVASFFDDVDMDQQINKQASFLTMVLGGPNNYTGKSMREAHAPLLARGLNDSHVDVVIEHLGATLKELGVDDGMIAEIAGIADSVRDDVLNR